MYNILKYLFNRILHCWTDSEPIHLGIEPKSFLRGEKKELVLKNEPNKRIIDCKHNNNIMKMIIWAEMVNKINLSL